jgi:ribose/xylose/arabinose/galactoside ABC-type transport system permease subunit
MTAAAVAPVVRKAFGLQKAFLAIVLVVLAMALLNLLPATQNQFFSSSNLVDSLLKSSSIYVILGMGETVVLVSFGVDLSIGGVMALTGIVAIELINGGIPIPVAIAACLVLGAVVGVVNGFLSVYQNLEPVIVTLGMWILLTGVGQQLTHANPVSCTDPSFQAIANSKILGFVPTLVAVAAVIVAAVHLVLSRTSFGRNCYAIGGDFEVAKYSGISVRRTKAATYVISGVTAAIGGVMLSSQLNAGNSIFGDQTALYVVCAVVVGGTSVAGGVGGAFKSLTGIILLGLVTNAMVQLKVDSVFLYLTQAVTGLIIVSILWLDSYGRKRRREDV